MRIILLVVLCFSFTVSIFTQTPDSHSKRCNVTSSMLPPMQGLKLGMSREEVLKVLNAPSLASIESASSDYQELQSLGIFKSKTFEKQIPINKSSSETARFSFELFDNKVSRLSLSSTRLFGEPNVKEFVKSFDKTFGIPKECLDINTSLGYRFTAKVQSIDFGMDAELSYTFFEMSFFLFGIDEKIAELKKSKEAEIAKRKEEQD